MLQIWVDNRRSLAGKVRNEIRLSVTLRLYDPEEQKQRKNRQELATLPNAAHETIPTDLSFQREPRPKNSQSDSPRPGRHPFWRKRAIKRCQENVKGLSGDHLARIDRTQLASS